MNKSFVIAIGAVVLTLAVIGFIYFRQNLEKQALNQMPEATSQTPAPDSPKTNLPTEQKSTLLAIGVFVPGQVWPQIKEKGVITFDSEGKQLDQISIPPSSIDLNNPPVVLDQSLNGRFIAVARNDGGPNNIYIYDFGSKKLESIPPNAETNTYVTGDELKFSPNSNLFLAPRNNGRWIGYRDSSGWKAVDLKTIIPEKNISLRFEFSSWNPNKAATIFAFGSRDNTNFGWVIDLQNGFDKAQITPVTIFAQLQKDGYHIFSFRWSDNGENAVVNLWKLSGNYKNQLRKISILSFDGSAFTLLKENIETEISSVLPLGERERFTRFRLSPISHSRIFVLKQTMYPVTEEDLGGAGGYIPKITVENEKDEWWVYDFQSKSLKKFFSEETQGLFNDYFWSPTNDYLAIRSEGTFRLISPDGTQILKDAMQASYTTGRSLPDHSFSWDRSGNHLVYLASAKGTQYERIVGSSPAQDVLKTASGGGVVKLYDFTTKATKPISVPEQWFMLDRGTASLLLK